MNGITMDGRLYRVRLIYPSLEETASLEDGVNAGKMLSGRRERDLDGTYYGHTLSVERDPRFPIDYDDFFDDITAPVPSHSITMPHGQGTITYDAMVYNVSRIYQGTIAGQKIWKGITVSFEPIRPQRRPREDSNA